VLVGDVAVLAGAVAELVPEVTVAAMGAPPEAMTDHPRVNHLLVSSGLPLRDHSALAVAVGGEGVGEVLPETIRVARPGARIVARGIPGAADHLRNAGLSLLLEEGDIVVATGRREKTTGRSRHRAVGGLRGAWRVLSRSPLPTRCWC
jgi:hypothetical protein